MSRPALASLSPEKLHALGAELHEITASLKDAGPDRKRRWFQGAVYSDLIVDFVAGVLTRFELSFEGQWLAVELEGASTGSTDEYTVHEAVPTSKLVTRDAAVSGEVVAAARELLSALCDTELRSALLRMLPA